MTLEDRIASIEQRNEKVTQDKAWETSKTRRQINAVIPAKAGIQYRCHQNAACANIAGSCS